MIKFPQIHIATSVVNRILNAADDIESRRPVRTAAPQGAPNVPDAAPLGAALDADIATPVGPVAETDPAMTADLTTGPLFP